MATTIAPTNGIKGGSFPRVLGVGVNPDADPLYWHDLRVYRFEEYSQMGPGPHLVVLTPDYARWLKGLGKSDRTLDQGRVDALARALESGHTSPNNDMLVLDENGVRRNGQHRCEAVIATGKNMMVWLWNLAPESIVNFIDGGRPRTPADWYRMRGEKHYTLLAAAARWIYSYDAGRPCSSTTVTLAEHDRVLAKYPAIRTIVSVVAGFEEALSLAPLAAVYTLAATRNATAAGEFFAMVGHGTQIPTKNHPAGKLRQRILGGAAEEGEEKKAPRTKNGKREKPSMDGTLRSALIIKAWNYHAAGVAEISQLKWTRRGARPEPFPTIA